MRQTSLPSLLRDSSWVGVKDATQGGDMASITESVDVQVPVRTAYDQWTQFEEFQRFMAGVRSGRTDRLRSFALGRRDRREAARLDGGDHRAAPRREDRLEDDRRPRERRRRHLPSPRPGRDSGDHTDGARAGRDHGGAPGARSDWTAGACMATSSASGHSSKSAASRRARGGARSRAASGSADPAHAGRARGLLLRVRLRALRARRSGARSTPPPAAPWPPGRP